MGELFIQRKMHILLDYENLSNVLFSAPTWNLD
jgi:hypothetical protein